MSLGLCFISASRDLVWTFPSSAHSSDQPSFLRHYDVNSIEQSRDKPSVPHAHISLSSFFSNKAKANNWESASICCQDVSSTPQPESLCSSIFVSAEMCSRRGNNTLILQYDPYRNLRWHFFSHLLSDPQLCFHIYLDTDWIRKQAVLGVTYILINICFMQKRTVFCSAVTGERRLLQEASMKRWQAHSSPLTK